jgi:hypothetical protein
MFCPNCGKEIVTVAKFCPHCGYKIASDATQPDNLNPIPKSKAKTKKTVIAIVAVLLCIAIGITIFFATSKSPKELLTENQWYENFKVNCEYYEFSYQDQKPGYWFSAWCEGTLFRSYGETEHIVYRIGGYGSAYGPFSYEITTENIPAHIEWQKEVKDYSNFWEILEDDTLKYNGEYYLWDDTKSALCECDTSECNHKRTWCVTKDYLRIGRYTYSSQKPKGANLPD